MEFSIEKGIGSQMSFIRTLCRRYLKDMDQVELLQSEALEKIWLHKDKFKGTEKDFRAWAFMVTRNIFITQYHREKKQRSEPIHNLNHSDEPSDPYDIESDLDNKKLLKDIIDTIKAKLDPDLFEAFKLRFIDDEKYEDIALKLNIPLGTAKNRIHRIRNFISIPGNLLN